MPTKFIKPFSRGQITIPKDYREYLGIDEDSWLKVSLWKNQILLQPVGEFQETRVVKARVSGKIYLNGLLKVKGDWFKEREFEKIRVRVEKRVLENEKNLT